MVVIALGAEEPTPAVDLTEHGCLTAYLSNFVHEISQPRHLFGAGDALRRTADRIFEEFCAAGLRTTRRPFTVPSTFCNLPGGDQIVENIEAVIPGSTPEIIVIGAHYDTFPPLDKADDEDCPTPVAPRGYLGTPGADDNGSGVATLLALARLLQNESRTNPFTRTIQLVAFVNEEPPFFRTSYMGSRQYARRCSEQGDRIVMMFTPETLGFYARRPDRKPGVNWLERLVFRLRMGFGGHYVAFLSDDTSIRLARQAGRAFAKHTEVPVRVGCFAHSSRKVPFGGLQTSYEDRARQRSRSDPVSFPTVRWSDDASFWQYGYPAFAVTDSAHLRNRRYHGPDDVPSSLDYETFARVVKGLHGMTSDWAH